MQDKNVPETLQPIIQGAQLLQARKTDEEMRMFRVCVLDNKDLEFVYTSWDDGEK